MITVVNNDIANSNQQFGDLVGIQLGNGICRGIMGTIMGTNIWIIMGISGNVTESRQIDITYIYIYTHIFIYDQYDI